MDKITLPTSKSMQVMQTIQELTACNEFTKTFGLELTPKQVADLAEKRFESLKSTGRVEFGSGILRMLIYEFCDSPFLIQENYEETLYDLLDSFYYFKNESLNEIPDDELIKLMHKYFDTVCQGSAEYLSSTTLEDLCRNTRYGFDKEDDDLHIYEPPL